MEKFLNRLLLTGNKLNIVNHQYVDIAVFLTEFRGGNVVFVSDCVDQFVCKFLGCHVQNLCARVIFQDEVGDGMH